MSAYSEDAELQKIITYRKRMKPFEWLNYMIFTQKKQVAYGKNVEKDNECGKFIVDMTKEG